MEERTEWYGPLHRVTLYDRSGEYVLERDYCTKYPEAVEMEVKLFNGKLDMMSEDTKIHIQHKKDGRKTWLTEEGGAAMGFIIEFKTIKAKIVNMEGE